jgi:hypothetical protein
MNTVNGNLTVLSTNSSQLRLTGSTSLTLTIGGDLIISGGSLDFANGSATTKVLNLAGDYYQTSGTFTNSNSNVLTFNFTGTNSTFTFSGGTLTNTYINWSINSGANLLLVNNLPVSASRSCTVAGSLDCGISFAVTGAGNFSLSSAGTLIIGSPQGITSSGATGNIQVSGTRTYSSSGKYTYYYSGAQVSGNGLPQNIGHLIVNGANPLTITNSTTSSSPFTAGNLEINLGQLELSAAQHMTVTGTTSLTGSGCLLLRSGSSGTASFIDNGISGTGTVAAERYIANDWKWHFLSAPVTDQPIWPEFAPAPSGSPLSFGSQPWNWDFYYWNPNADLTNALYWVNIRKSNGEYNDATIDQGGSYAGFGSSTPPQFTVGRGYLASYNSGWTTGSPTIHTFSGTLNSGSINSQVITGANYFNLVGNPYSSPIDWKASSGWNRSNLEVNGGGYDYWIFNDNAGNYGVFNSSGTTGTNGTSQYISQNQAFFVKASSSGSLVMTNSTRSHSNQSWLKKEESDNNYISLKISCDANSFNDEMIVSINPDLPGGGSVKFWSLYTDAPELYSSRDENNYSIDRYSDLNNEITVNANVKIGVNGQYTLSTSNINHFYPDRKVILEDLKTGISTDLRHTPTYTFTANTVDNPDRFRLIIGAATGINETIANNFNIYSYAGAVLIKSKLTNISYRVVVTNMIGQVIAQKEVHGISFFRFELSTPPGMYVVTVLSEGKSFSKKVIL